MSMHTVGILLLLLVTAFWGSTFSLVKDATEHMPTSSFIAWRFSIAILPLLLFLRKTNPKLWRDGMILGAWLGAGYITQAIGLQTIGANRAAFITGLNVILVPIGLAVMTGRKISPGVWISVVLCALGISLISWEGGSLAIGDLWTLGCALTYAGYIIYLERTAKRHEVLPLTAIQILAVVLIGWLWAGIEATQHMGHLEDSLVTNFKAYLSVPPEALWPLIYLGLAATALTTMLQVIGQKFVTAVEAAIIYALEPVTASIFAFFWAGEVLGLRGISGGALIVLAMVLSQLPDRKEIVPVQE
ncbi:DMT family transporter [Deinococcus cellulosilyticus]|uniref:Permease n=1 Tax=Deinococcus cellulosilyticus (strain DSM 18568 / NBRC 106333 / KACC 11606 / 5516J-15) TaxID=1223518 RepID=A0A511N882_DEIC1|nr:DMT family transporter [Deinococcus cellulosilyticus]GEM49045.1 permease [Deinococcus cellulosilyticus NBRC 106333 = KACC 11606]